MKAIKATFGILVLLFVFSTQKSVAQVVKSKVAQAKEQMSQSARQDSSNALQQQLGDDNFIAPVLEMPVLDENSVYTYVENPPHFPGGDSALFSYLNEHLVFPKVAIDSSYQGTVYVQFIVGKTGELSDVKELKGVRGVPYFTTEAIRLVKAMPKWIPGENQGIRVKTQYNLPIKFVDRFTYQNMIKEIATNRKIPVINEDSVYKSVDEQATFPDGDEAMLRFLADNLHYPLNEIEKEIMGQVILSFVVDKNGDKNFISVLKEVEGGPGLTEEAIRVVKLMPKFIPARIDGKAVNVQYNMAIRFQRR